jgi:hypothetical protein
MNNAEWERNHQHIATTREEKTRIFDDLASLAVAEAIERHRRLGESIVIWRDGEIVTLTADEIPPQNLEQPKEFKTDA